MMLFKSKNFIKHALLISFPIILQQLFLNFASLLDNVMVGQLDDASVSGVYVATQIIFVINMMIFGSIEGATVFFSQFYGKNDEKHMRNVFAFKFISSLLISSLITLIVLLFGKNLVSLFVKTDKEIQVATDYLNVVVFTIIPFSISNILASTLRESHKTLSPMIITVVGIGFNVFFNYGFIFGKLGLPCLNAVGAAYGTLIDRGVELISLIALVVIKRYSFSKDFFRSFKIEKTLFKNLIIKSLPLFFNETLWAFSQTILVYVYTKCNPIATTSLPIALTIFNLLFVVLIGLGNGISIIVGNTVGQNKLDEAQEQAYDSLWMTLFFAIGIGLILVFGAPLFAGLYSGVSAEAKDYAIFFIRYYAVYIIITGLNTSIFFLLRAGGRTGIVFFFDSFYGYIISIPFAILLESVTSLDLKMLFVLVYSMDILKTIIGMVLLIKRKWFKNLTIEVDEKQALSE